MARRPFFRSFDGWWYAHVGTGPSRKKVKLARGKDNEQDAYRVFCRLMADTGLAAPTPTTLTVAYLCDRFLDVNKPQVAEATFAQYKHFLQRFCDLHGSRLAAEVRPFHVTHWLDANPTWKGSRWHAVTAVKRAFNWGVTEGYLDTNPIKAVKKPEPGKRDRVLTDAERREIVAAIKDPAFKDFVVAMLETGCRPGEVARVEAKDVNLELGVWMLAKHKTGKKTKKPRIVYLTAAMIELSKRLMAQWPAGPLFRTPLKKTAFTRNNIRTRFSRLRAKFPHLKGVVAYTLRHNYATQALVRGVGIAQVAELLGHVDTKMVSQNYAHLAGQVSHMRQSAEQAVAG
ncbi:MAG TPA: site-specific integrase [Gemmataceae bacterium]|jgi:integrase|nr:site-specific integrase [Gemmataceae bacterium]